MDKRTSGIFIREMREEKGLSVEELAEKMGVSANAVTKWEEDASMPDEVNKKPLCEILGIGEDELANAERNLTEAQRTLRRKDANRKSVIYGIGSFAAGVLLFILRYTVFTSDNKLIHAIGSMGVGIGVGLIVLGFIWFYSGIAGKAMDTMD